MVSKHDRLVNILSRNTRKDVDFKWRNTEYGFKDNVIGEIDLLMYSDGILWMFEVKSTPNPHMRDKAGLQMERAKTKFVPLFEERGHTVNQVLTFYVHGYRGKRNMRYSMYCLSNEYKGLNT